MSKLPHVAHQSQAIYSDIYQYPITKYRTQFVLMLWDWKAYVRSASAFDLFGLGVGWEHGTEIDT